jgi:hypothetical protein
MKIEVSNGEIVDKYTILEIKKEKCEDPVKLKNILTELSYLTSIVENLNIPQDLLTDLKKINLKLWEVEDLIRLCENKKTFDEKFIELARLVYITNDMRFKLKNEINKITQSLIVEEKILPEY